MGRPTKLTPARKERLLEAVRRGAPYATACLYAGVHFATFRRWLLAAEQEGADGSEAGVSKRELRAFREFREELLAAEGEAAMGILDEVREAGGKDWKASAWLLARRYPDEFGERREVVHSGGIAIGDKIAAIAESLKSGAAESEAEGLKDDPG